MYAVTISATLSSQPMEKQELHKPVMVDVSAAADRPRGIELPHSRGCFVCGQANPLGLHLCSRVEPESGVVSIDFTPKPEHEGFAGIVHGGITATVVDEAMTWAATWRARRFCVCAELTVRLRAQIRSDQSHHIEAAVDFSRPTMVETAAKITDARGKLVATATGKYMVLAQPEHEALARTMIDEPATAEARTLLGFQP